MLYTHTSVYFPNTFAKSQKLIYIQNLKEIGAINRKIKECNKIIWMNKKGEKYPEPFTYYKVL